MKEENENGSSEQVNEKSEDEESVVDPEKYDDDDDKNNIDEDDDNNDDDDDDDDDDDVYGDDNIINEDNSIPNEFGLANDTDGNTNIQDTVFNINNNYNSVDLENNDSMEFLQKFTKDYKNDYIQKYHQESLNKNYNEIKELTTVQKDSNNNIIDALHKTIPILTKYERTKILGIRLKQLNNGCKSYITVSDTILDNFIIANMELEQKILPFIISRPLPNNTCEYWKLQDLELI